MMGIEVHEALLSSDDAARELVYSVVSSPLPIDSHRATITVHPAAAGARVTWACEVTPDEHVEMLGGIYSQGLDALKAHLEK